MEQVDQETNMWKNTLQSSDLHSIAVPRLFIERATIHGFSFIYEGVKYAPRFREIHKELKGEVEAKWILFLDFLNVVFRCEGENRLYLDFTSLEQSQLMFRCNRLNTPITNQAFLVERVKRNRWMLIQ